MAVYVAPKDPEQQRPYFYIMRDKDIFGAKREDGKGISFLYQSDGRLISSAKIVGNITDEKMLKLLETVDGFKTLVHSIGICIEGANSNDVAEFVFQMYGKEDLYGGGTNLIAEVTCNGAEKRIYMSDVQWREDDNIPGQIQIITARPDELAKLSVRFYLNDGFEAPEAEEEIDVNIESEAYKTMIKKSFMQTGNNHRIYNAIRKAKAGEDVTLAYIGGSITQGAGANPINTECYAYKSFQKFAQLYGQGDNVHFIKAGVGGTPSELGMLRFDRDILRDGETPDIVVVEFAVNDEGDETKGNCYESLVKKILLLPNKPAVILLFSVFADDGNLQERLSPVGKRYDLPMVSVKNAVTPQFYEKDKVLSKNQFFYDMFHPTNVGHTIMSDCLINLCEVVREQVENQNKEDKDYEDSMFTGEVAIGADFVDVKLLDKKDGYDKAVINCGGFDRTDSLLQSVEMDDQLEMTKEFPYNWMYDGTDGSQGSFEMEIECKALLIITKDSGEVDTAKAEIYVDGKWVRQADPFINGWLHCNPLLLLNEKETKKHKVEVKVSEGDEKKKFTILGFGYVE